MASLFAKLTQLATQPLVPQIAEGWNNVANVIDDPNSGSSNVPLARARGAVAGMAQGLGNVAAGATSPLGLLSLLAGSTGLDKLTTAARAAKAAQAAEGVMPSLPAEFTAVGAEPPYVRPTYPNSMESAYQALLKRGGR